MAWAVVGLAGVGLLAPTLALPDGMPSPSELLRQMAPWQGLEAGASRNTELMDLSFMIEPWMLHLKRELLAGRLPFWNPHQFAGAPFWGNGSSAVLSPFSWVFAALPITWGFTVVAWLRILIGGLGAYRLARELGVRHEAALLAAVVFPLSGRLTAFLLFPMANALAFVPWVFLAVERLAQGKKGLRLLAVAAALQLVGGHPETPFFTGIAAAMYLALRGAENPRRAWGRALAGWVTGAALAGAALVPLALTILGSARWQEWSPGEPASLAAIAGSWLRWVLPDAFGHPGSSYWGALPFVPTTVYAGAVALPLAACGLGSRRADRRLRALALMALVCFLCSYHLPGIRQLLQATPFLQKSLHHYLLLAVELALAQLAACGLDSLLESRRRGLGLGFLALAGVLACGWFALAADWRQRGLLAQQAGWTLGFLAVASLPLLLARAGAVRRLAWAPALVALTAADLALANGRTLPAISAEHFFPETPAISFLRGKEGRVAAPGFVLRPNTAMVFELADVRGDDSLKFAPYEALYRRELGAPDPIYFRPLERWQSPWLDRLGVRWVLTQPGSAPFDPAWRLAYDGAEARIFERPGALALASLAPPEAGRLTVEEHLPGRWRLAWELAGPARLVIAESHAPGWRAWVKGEAVPIETVDGLLMGVPLPAGRGTAELRYRPPGLAAGVLLSCLGLVALALARRYE